MIAFRIVIGLLLAAFFGLPTLLAAEVGKKKATFRIAGYVPDYRVAGFDGASARCLTDLILFSAEPASTGGLNVDRLKRVSWEALRRQKAETGVRLILCIGGWGRSTHFATVSRNDELRSIFVKSVVEFCQREGFDGVDLDWEHPRNEEEQVGYGRLLADLREAFDPLGLKLSVTLAGWQRLPPAAFVAVDWVQIMAYDNPGQHSTYESAVSEIEKVVGMGAAKNKIILGLPFYGRGIVQRDRTMTYRDIVTRHRPDKGVNEVDGVYFNGPDLIQRKTALAIDEGLAGVMVWELGQDAPGEGALMKIICDAVEASKLRP